MAAPILNHTPKLNGDDLLHKDTYKLTTSQDYNS